MKETQFIEKRQREWAAWDRWLSGRTRAAKPAKSSRRRKDAAEAPPAPVDEPEISLTELPSAFRRLCQDLSLARDRHYSSPLVHALHNRVRDGDAGHLAHRHGGFNTAYR